jgi:uncharacterized membrane protein
MQVFRYHVENVRRFLGNHWAIRLLVVPVLFLATIVALYAVGSGNTGAEAATVVVGYLGFSLAAVLLGLLVEAIGRALTGGSLVGP